LAYFLNKIRTPPFRGTELLGKLQTKLTKVRIFIILLGLQKGPRPRQDNLDSWKGTKCYHWSCCNISEAWKGFV